MMKSPLAYIGGKSKLTKTIVPMIPDHKVYCEVFAGGAWVFFGKEPSKVEVLNDLDGDLISFYRVVKNHPGEFLKQLNGVLLSREMFEDWKAQLSGRGLTDIQKATRYYYIQRLAFGGRVRNRSFGVQVDRTSPRYSRDRLEKELDGLNTRLSKVTIEHLSWDKLIERYDRPDTFFYCDPPYYKAPYYNHNFVKEDFIQLADVLSQIQGRFLLSINNHPDIVEIFKQFNKKEVSVPYSIKVGKPTLASELIYSNF